MTKSNKVANMEDLKKENPIVKVEEKKKPVNVLKQTEEPRKSNIFKESIILKSLNRNSSMNIGGRSMRQKKPEIHLANE